jgi:hypothetical protein
LAEISARPRPATGRHAVGGEVAHAVLDIEANAGHQQQAEQHAANERDPVALGPARGQIGFRLGAEVAQVGHVAREGLCGVGPESARQRRVGPLRDRLLETDAAQVGQLGGGLLGLERDAVGLLDLRVDGVERLGRVLARGGQFRCLLRAVGRQRAELVEACLGRVAVGLQRTGDLLRVGGDVRGLAAQVVDLAVRDLVVLHGLLDLVQLAPQVVDLLGRRLRGRRVVGLGEGGPRGEHEEGDEENSQGAHSGIIRQAESRQMPD